MKPIYLDYNSTTPVDPRVFEAMKPYFVEKFGNAASMTHPYGWEADQAVDKARGSIAQLIGAGDKKTILFTSGATECNNMVIKGIARGCGKRAAHVITQKTEHKCILDSCRQIQKEGHEVTILNVDEYGRVRPDDVKAAIKKNTVLCSIMAANNEIGTIQPIAEISKICREQGIYFHSDAVQAVGKIPVDVEKEGIDLLSISGHKIYGPKGIGALYLRQKKPPIPLSPLLEGGGHERGKRSGTLNVPGIVGLAKAMELCAEEQAVESKRLAKLRDKLIREVTGQLGQVSLNGHPSERLPNNVNFSFPYIKSNDLILAMPEIAVATGSACSSGAPEPSYVIRAITDDEDRVNSTIRIGLGRWTTDKDVDTAIEVIVRAVKKLRSVSPQYEMKRDRGSSLRGVLTTKQSS